VSEYGYTDHTGCYMDHTGCHRLHVLTMRPARVAATPGCCHSIGYMDRL
jgi:hypothetical protein